MSQQPQTIYLGPPKIAHFKGVRAGDRNLIRMTISAADGPMDLTGVEITAHARKKSTDESPVAIAEITVLDALAGQIDLRWPGDQVTAVLAGKATVKGVWDLQIQSPGEDPITLIYGNFEAEMDVTR